MISEWTIAHPSICRPWSMTRTWMGCFRCLAQPNSVSLYQKRYPDMPRPVVNLGPKRPLLWLRPEIEEWARGRAKHG